MTAALSLYGRPVRGMAWHPNALKHILRSEAALGYLMHGTRPVLGDDGRPVRLAEPLWDRSTHEALLAKTGPKRTGSRAPKGMQLLSGIGFCGNCGTRLYLTGWSTDSWAYGCTARGAGSADR